MHRGRTYAAGRAIMANIETSFLGLSLRSPIIVGSSSLTRSPARIAELEKAGAGAVVLKSLFEEQILASIGKETSKGGVIYGQEEVDGYISFYERKHSIDEYIGLIRAAKEAVSIPVISSINATSGKEWQGICIDLAEAGADALQLNLFVDPFDFSRPSEEIERTYFEIVRKVREVTDMPVAVKIGSSFTNTGRLVAGLAEAGARAAVLFNRYYSPDFDLGKREVKAGQVWSDPGEYLPSLRWTALLSATAGLPLVGATGIHDGRTVTKMILAGAYAVEVVSTVYRNGDAQITKMNDELAGWMDDSGYSTLESFRGGMARDNTADPHALERVQYMKHFGDV